MGWELKQQPQSNCLPVLQHLLLLLPWQAWLELPRNVSASCSLQTPAQLQPRLLCVCAPTYLQWSAGQTIPPGAFSTDCNEVWSGEVNEKNLFGFPGSNITRTDQLSPQIYHCLRAEGSSLSFVQTANYRKNFWLTDHKLVKNQRESEEMLFCWMGKINPKCNFTGISANSTMGYIYHLQEEQVCVLLSHVLKYTFSFPLLNLFHLRGLFQE